MRIIWSYFVKKFQQFLNYLKRVSQKSSNFEFADLRMFQALNLSRFSKYIVQSKSSIKLFFHKIEFSYHTSIWKFTLQFQEKISCLKDSPKEIQLLTIFRHSDFSSNLLGGGLQKFGNTSDEFPFATAWLDSRFLK